jgi:transcription-repair coupling factor (superfamily II helicase)
VARFRLLARAAGVTEVVAQGSFIRFAPAQLPDSRELRLSRVYPGSVIKDAHILVPRPMASVVPKIPLVGAGLLDWAGDLVRAVYAPA